MNSLRFWTPRLGLLLLASACTPDVGDDSKSTDPNSPLTAETMSFDSTSTPKRVPEPSFLVIDPTTKKINLALGGTVVPASCGAPVPDAARASCEFAQYLQSLDGFPTVTTAKAPANTALNPTTLTPTNVVVVNGTTVQPEAARTVTFDETNAIIIKPKPVWPVGQPVYIGVRGYGAGVRAANGHDVIAVPTFAFIKRIGPGETIEAPQWLLTCGADKPSATPDPQKCSYLTAIAQGAPVTDATRDSLFALEQARRGYLQSGTWRALGDVGGLPREQIAVAFGFPVHSNSVIEIDPTSGRVPVVTGGKQIALAVNGKIKADTLKPSKLGAPGTVALVDLTTLAAGSLYLPTFTVGYDDAQNTITLTTPDAAPLQTGHTYAIVMSREVTNPAGLGMVPPPVSVFLMATGPLSLGNKSTVSTLGDFEASFLEANRQQLQPAFVALQEILGWSRARIAYFYAFSI